MRRKTNEHETNSFAAKERDEKGSGLNDPSSSSIVLELWRKETRRLGFFYCCSFAKGKDEGGFFNRCGGERQADGGEIGTGLSTTLI